MEQVWKIMENQLYFISMAFSVKIHSFVLMDNHFHLLISTPNSNLSIAMRWFMLETARSINLLTGRKNQVWGGRFYRTIIKSHLYFLHAYKYVYRNPVKSGAYGSVLEYNFSSLAQVLSFRRMNFPIYDNILIEMGPGKCISWLEQSVIKQHWEQVAKALRKTTFKLTPNKNSTDLSELEISLL